jgi:cytosine/adenosine deaminase-related metal-dependent hydrolase
MSVRTLTARWIFPVDQPPLSGGTLTIKDDRILAVEPAGVRTADLDLGNAAILPGFTNAHTHLDLSGAFGHCPPSADFIAWLKSVIAFRRRQTPEDVERAIAVGLSQCARYGTTLVGDIASAGQSWRQLASAPLRGVVFFELLGLSWERARESLKQGQSWLEESVFPVSLKPGFSPHAPYSVHFHLMQEAARLSRERNTPLSIHLAETEAELELLDRHTGPFVHFLKEMGVWQEDGLAPSLEAVLDLAQTAGCLSFVHGNYLKSPKRFPRNAAIIFCPRTHVAFCHKTHPLRDLLASGVRIALGTDSLASNPDLDVLAEVRFVHEKYEDISGSTLLEMASLNGAAALGWDKETGTLTPGKSADMVVLPLPDVEVADPHDLVLESSLPISQAYYRGKVIDPEVDRAGIEPAT